MLAHSTKCHRRLVASHTCSNCSHRSMTPPTRPSSSKPSPQLERVKAAAAARQARLTAAFDAARRSAEASRGVPAERRGRGIGSEVALARRDSPARGGRHVGFAKALVHEMPYTWPRWRLVPSTSGGPPLWFASRRVSMSTIGADLTPSCAPIWRRWKVWAAGCWQLRPDRSPIAWTRAVVDRAAKANADRTVTIRPAPDTMTYVTALLPVAQGVSVYAALKREADVCSDGRSRGQVMADTLIEAGHWSQRLRGSTGCSQSG